MLVHIGFVPRRARSCLSCVVYMYVGTYVACLVYLSPRERDTLIGLVLQGLLLRTEAVAHNVELVGVSRLGPSWLENSTEKYTVSMRRLLTWILVCCIGLKVAFNSETISVLLYRIVVLLKRCCFQLPWHPPTRRMGYSHPISWLWS